MRNTPNAAMRSANAENPTLSAADQLSGSSKELPGTPAKSTRKLSVHTAPRTRSITLIHVLSRTVKLRGTAKPAVSFACATYAAGVA